MGVILAGGVLIRSNRYPVVQLVRRTLQSASLDLSVLTTVTVADLRGGRAPGMGLTVWMQNLGSFPIRFMFSNSNAPNAPGTQHAYIMAGETIASTMIFDYESYFIGQAIGGTSILRIELIGVDH